jgi:3-phosphoshikimate 1-carboxyvinyltransferase
VTGRGLPAGRLSGRLRVPGSKSFTNRALVAAALARGESRLVAPLVADDTRTMVSALARLGAHVETGAEWVVTGPLAPGGREEVLLDIGPAGTPARFLLALLAALPGRYLLDGSPRMRERPMGPLVDALREVGASITPVGREGFLPLRIEGRTLHGGAVRIRGDVSSQFLSALLLASPLVPGGLALDVVGPLSSAAYVDMTRRTIAAFSRGPARFAVPGDDSAACFPIAGAVASRGRVELEGLYPEPEQPDAVFRRWARAAGAEVSFSGTGEGAVLVVDASALAAVRPINADVDAAPDAALPLAAMLAFAGGTSCLTGVARLREKESDRLAAAVELLTAAGAVARVECRTSGSALVIEGRRGIPRRASFLVRDDHRVAMSAAILALTLPTGSDVDDPGVVSKSYPEFFVDWERLALSA